MTKSFIKWAGGKEKELPIIMNKMMKMDLILFWMNIKNVHIIF